MVMYYNTRHCALPGLASQKKAYASNSLNCLEICQINSML